MRKNKLKCGLGKIFISFKAQLLSTMAGQLGAACKKPSWVRAFFRVENRSLVDKLTGTEKEFHVMCAALFWTRVYSVEKFISII
jgi:hypothetical protein